MDSKKLAIYKSRLEEIRSSLVGDVAKNLKTTKEELTEPVADITDDAAQAYTRQLMVDLGEQDWQKFKQVEEALEKIKNGEYGICTLCENPIPEARLDVVPYAQYCVACLSKIESEKKSTPSPLRKFPPKIPGDFE